MKRWSFIVAIIALMTVLVSDAIDAQNGSPHGNNGTWTPPSPIGGSGVIQGYYVFRCLGTCTVTSTGWVSVSSLLTTTTFLDPASGLTTNTTYSYAVEVVDSNGNDSGFSPIATVAVGASFPSNPNPATNNVWKVQ